MDIVQENGEIELSRTEKILRGFQINWIKLQNADNGSIIWQEAKDFSDPSQIHEITLPTNTLEIKAVQRIMSFSTVEELKNFRVVHTAKFKGKLLEQLSYTMGAFKPATTNTVINIIESAPESQMMPAKVLNGKVCIETDFYDENEKFATSTIKLFYS
ncbi:probable cGMP 3',5'-cyclic phosphodiesterase subunit delta [Chironomus tepperi]|uniref:probable cGMP 3',5'-cyclic phosphodiesterase subunit delta n=1 Tax=Chironomus tepperi TaxID=113505 RepID=UPI00391F3076